MISPIDVLPKHKYDSIHYKLIYQIEQLFNKKDHPNIIIYGKKRCGKTTIIRLLFNELFEWKKESVNNNFHMINYGMYYYFDCKNIINKNEFIEYLKTLCKSKDYSEKHKYIILDSDSIYYGGLGLYEGNIFIDGHGAVIDLEFGNGIWIYADEYYPCSLEIKYCTIINGQYYGLSFGGTSVGNIENCNFINNDMGVKLYDQSSVSINNSNFINNITYGIGIYTEEPICNISYSNAWNNGEYDYMENCPG